MLQMIEVIKRPVMSFSDFFFSREITHDTDILDIDKIVGKRKMANFSDPARESILVKNNGFTTQTIKLPYIKEKKITTALDLMNRDAGSTIYDKPLSPAMRASIKLARDFEELRDRVLRRIEWMAVKSILDGTLTLTGDGVNQTVDFLKSGTHHAALTGATQWDQTTATVEANIKSWCRTIQRDSGILPTTCVHGYTSAQTFMDNAEVKSKLDNRRMELGKIEPQYIPEGMSYIGRFAGLDHYEYVATYTNDSDAEIDIFDPKKLVIGSPTAICEKHFGAIRDLDVNAAVKFFPKTFKVEDPSAIFALLQSAPLCIPHEIDAFFTAQVIV